MSGVRHLWIGRHAEATSDESGLSPAGEQQARLLGERLSGTVIRYFPDGRTRVIIFNDLSHLPPALRWTGMPPELSL